MLITLTVLLGMQLIGEAITRGFGLTVPGPVIGFALLAIAMATWNRLRATVEPTATELLRHLSLLFIPAAVGVTDQLPRLASEGLVIGAAVVVSTVATLAVTGLTFQLVARLLSLRDER
jgi:putative effector of murein hydrolase LrgA (UPF0299 family)